MYVCSLNIDNLEKDVNALKTSVTSTEKALADAPDDVKKQLGEFIEVCWFVFILFY